MSNYPPFMNATGRVKTILDKVVTAQTPPRFTYDFLETKLGSKGGSAKPMVSLLKRIGFIHTDGTPTDLYAKFRTDSGRGAAMAEALKIGYADVFERNEYANELPKDKFRDLVIEMTGLEKTSSTVTAIVGTFFALKEYANFENLVATEEQDNELQKHKPPVQYELSGPKREQTASDVGLNLSYTINLNLPETSDVEVFNAIFRSLKENLLSKN